MQYSQEDLELLQKCEEYILKEVDKLCIENDISYFVGGGTAIGQRRHGGFIPWDDDMDINIARNDYNKFLEVAKKELPDTLFLQNHLTDYGFPNFYSKIRLRGTKFVEALYRNSDIEQGIYIDVFPMDDSLDDEKYLNKMNSTISRIYFLYECRIVSTSSQMLTSISYRIRQLFKKIVHCALCVLPAEFYANAYYKFLKNNEVNSDFLADFATNGGKGFIVNKNIVFPVKRAKFDSIEVNIPNDIDTFLCLRYGDDFMTLPPVEKRINHSPLVLDFGKYNMDNIMKIIND